MREKSDAAEDVCCKTDNSFCSLFEGSAVNCSRGETVVLLLYSSPKSASFRPPRPPAPPPSLLSSAGLLCVLGLGHRGDGAEAEEGADRSQSLGQSAGGLPEPPVQRLLPNHQGTGGGLFLCLLKNV